MDKPNLIRTWLAIQTNAGEPIGLVAAELSAATGVFVSTSRLREWQDGRRGLPERVHNHMLKTALFRALADEGINISPEDDLNNRLAAKLSLPERPRP